MPALIAPALAAPLGAVLAAMAALLDRMAEPASAIVPHVRFDRVAGQVAGAAQPRTALMYARNAGAFTTFHVIEAQDKFAVPIAQVALDPHSDRLCRLDQNHALHVRTLHGGDVSMHATADGARDAG